MKSIWKKLPVFVKGGLVGLLLYIIVTIVLIFGDTPDYSFLPLWYLPSALGSFPLVMIVNSITGHDYMDEFFNDYLYISMISSILLFFIIFGLIGWIIDFIKKQIH